MFHFTLVFSYLVSISRYYKTNQIDQHACTVVMNCRWDMGDALGRYHWIKGPYFCPPYVLFNQDDATMAGHEASAENFLFVFCRSFISLYHCSLYKVTALGWGQYGHILGKYSIFFFTLKCIWEKNRCMVIKSLARRYKILIFFLYFHCFAGETKCIANVSIKFTI